MINVYKHGKLEPIVFECPTCGCVFEATNFDDVECEVMDGIPYHIICKCPDCGLYVSAGKKKRNGGDTSGV